MEHHVHRAPANRATGIHGEADRQRNIDEDANDTVHHFIYYASWLQRQLK